MLWDKAQRDGGELLLLENGKKKESIEGGVHGYKLTPSCKVVLKISKEKGVLFFSEPFNIKRLQKEIGGLVNKRDRAFQYYKKLGGYQEDAKQQIKEMRVIVWWFIEQMELLSVAEEEGERLLLKLEEEQEDSSAKQKRIKKIKKRIKGVARQRVARNTRGYQDEIIRLLKKLGKRDLSKIARKRIERTVKQLQGKIKQAHEKEEYRSELIEREKKHGSTKGVLLPRRVEQEDKKEMAYIMNKRKTYHRGVIGCSFAREGDINIIGSTIINI